MKIEESEDKKMDERNNGLEQITPIESDFIDEDGEISTINIQPMNSVNVNLGQVNKYKLSNQFNKKNPFKKNGLLRMDVGVRSRGFARVTILATIISVSAILILYFMFRL